MGSLILKAAAVMVAALALWVAFGTLAVVAPNGPRLGVLPPWWLLALFALLSSAAALIMRRVWLALFGFAPLLLPWLPSRVPAAFLVWTGPLLILLAIAALLAAGFQAARGRATGSGILMDPRRAPLVVAVLSVMLYGAAAWRVAPMIPGGDEPHYLVITQSLLYDFDLKIENNHARRDYRAYVEMDLRPDYIQRGTDGEIYSIHMPGLSLLVAPAFLVAGYPGAVAFIVLLAASAGALLWRLIFEVARDAGPAWFGWAAVALSVPIVFHSFTIYPDSAAVLPVLIGVLALLRATGEGTIPAARPGAWVGYGGALAALLWLHSRFALLAGGFGVLILLRLMRRPRAVRNAAAFLSLPVLSAAGWFGFFLAIYGSPNPRAQYGGLLDATSSPAYITSGIGGLLFDQQFGILTHAPVYACGLAGILLMLRGRRGEQAPAAAQGTRLAVAMLTLAAPYLITTTTVRMWWGGWSAPGRFLVALLPLLGFGAAVAWQRAQRRATRAAMLGALGMSAAMSTILVWVDRGRLAYDVRQTDALWLQWAGPLADLARGVPTFIRTPEPGAWIQSAVWVAALLGAWFAVRACDRLVRSRTGVALALVATYAAAGMLALAVVWRLNHSDGVQPVLAQLEVLRAAARANGVAVAFAPLTRLTPDRIAERLTLVPDARYGVGRDGQLMALPGPIPAGDYTLHPLSREGNPGESPAPPMVGRLSAGIGREFVPLWNTALDGSPTLDVRFPVDVRAIVVRGDEQAVGRIAAMTVRPRAVVPADRKASGGYARQAVRYPGAIVYFMDEGVFPEPDAFWIRGGRSATVVFDPQAQQSATALFIRNAPVANILRIEAAGWRDELTLRPGEERRISIPSDPNVRGTRVRFASASGFRPSEVVTSSDDQRFLGVWVRLD